MTTRTEAWNPATLACLVCLWWGSIAAAEVRLEKVPEGGLQPQVAADEGGAIHLVFLKGEPGACDVRHAVRKAGENGWSAPVTVNRQPGTAVAMGTIRGAQLAVGMGGVIHVVWNGPGAKDQPSALYYTRSTDGGATFEPQRNLIGDTRFLDGGASVAAGPENEVFVVWHALPAGAEPGEIHRRVFVARSRDGGRAFDPPVAANGDTPGVCACCSLKALVTPAGELVIAYRAARSIDQRDVVVMISNDRGNSFRSRVAGRWGVAACPMSSMALMTAVGETTWGAWETDGRIYLGVAGAEDREGAAISGGSSRHPSIAVNARGEVLVSWSVGTGWQKGGKLAWALLDSGGQPTGNEGTQPGVPVWGATAAFPQGDDFVVLH